MKRARLFLRVVGWEDTFAGGKCVCVCMHVCVCVCACVHDGETSPQSLRQDWGFEGTPVKQGRIHPLRKWSSRVKILPRKRLGPSSGQRSSCLSFSLGPPSGGGGVGMLQAVAGGAILPCRIHCPAHPL